MMPFIFLIFLVQLILLYIFYKINNGWLYVINGISMTLTGLYVYGSGISIYKNIMTQAIGLMFLLFGVYILLVTTLNLIDDKDEAIIQW